jgi:hypothetical protein
MLPTTLSTYLAILQRLHLFNVRMSSIYQCLCGRILRNQAAFTSHSRACHAAPRTRARGRDRNRHHFTSGRRRASESTPDPAVEPYHDHSTNSLLPDLPSAQSQGGEHDEAMLAPDSDREEDQDTPLLLDTPFDLDEDISIPPGLAGSSRGGSTTTSSTYISRRETYEEVEGRSAGAPISDEPRRRTPR